MKSTFNIKTYKSLSFILSFILLATAFSSCKKDKDNADVNVAAVAITNAGASSAPQDVYFDNQRVNTTALAYTQTAGYFRVSGSPTITFKTTNTADVNASTATSFTPGKYYSVYYTDDKAITVYENDRTAPASGKARVRFINLTTAAGSAVDFGIKGGAKIVNGLTYKAASAYQDVDASSGFSLYAGGSSTVLLDFPATLTAGGVYTIYISGSSSATVIFKLIAEN